MSDQKHTGYMLLFRGTDWTKNVSPEEIQGIVNQWMEWFQRLGAEGKVSGGNPLEASGKVVSGKGGRNVADGPFAESKEAIAGYFVLNVNSMEEALAIAKQCPGLAHGSVVEVRPMLEECPLKAQAKEHELAGAA